MGRLANCMEFIKNSSSINLLTSKAEDLRRETRHLINLRAEALEDVYRGKNACRRRRWAEHWLKEVIKVVHDIREFQSSFETIDGFPLKSRYWLGRTLDKLLSEVLELQGEKALLVAESIPDPLEPQTIPPRAIFGMEDNFSKIQGMLTDDGAEVIGIYGAGGVGKTTLLIETYKHALEKNSDRFDLVIFVTVSNYVSTDAIQKLISGRLGFDDLYKPRFPKEYEERRATLRNALLGKKFLLLFDDLGEKLDLAAIGVPLTPASKKGSKVVFTTRSLEVCTDMGSSTSTVEVCRLSESRSWELFCEKVGKRSEEDWTGSSKSIAEEMVAKCRGLPLALITVGSAMAGAAADNEWEEALTELQGTSAELEDFKYVLTLLKFSFDRLKDKWHKECLLHCALYSEGYNIDIDELIDFWVGEGYLEADGGSIDGVRNHGHVIIAALKRACLLEDGNTQNKKAIFLSNHGRGLETAPTPMEAIPLFSRLWSLKVQKINTRWTEGWKNSDEDANSLRLKDLDELKHLEELDLEIRVDSEEDWCNLRKSRKLRSVSTGLFIKLVRNIVSFDLFKDLGGPSQLAKISVIDCFNLSRLIFPANHATKVKELHLMNLKVRKIEWKDEISIVREPTKCAAFENLQKLFLLNVPLQEMTWVRRLPCLADLRISCTDEMVEMIPIEESDIGDMDSKREPFFRVLFVWECPMLKKLPFQTFLISG